MKYTFAVMVVYLLLASRAFGEEVISSPCILPENPVYYQIIRNNPGIDRNYAFELAYLIQKKADKYKVPSNKLAAILAQESMYTLDKKNCKNGKCTDFGISQIHSTTIRKFNFSKKKLLTDLEYSIEAGAIILADFKRMYAKKEKDWWTRYNTSKPKKREEYKRLVLRYM